MLVKGPTRVHPKKHMYKLRFILFCCGPCTHVFPDSKIHEANMGPIWGRQDPGGAHVGPMNFAIWVLQSYFTSLVLGTSKLTLFLPYLEARWFLIWTQTQAMRPLETAHHWATWTLENFHRKHHSEWAPKPHLLVGVLVWPEETCVACYVCVSPGLIRGLYPANERRRYFVTPSVTGWAQT